MRDQKRLQRDDKLQDEAGMGNIVDKPPTQIFAETVNKEDPKKDAENGHLTDTMRDKHRGTFP